MTEVSEIKNNSADKPKKLSVEEINKLKADKSQQSQTVVNK